MPCFPLAVVDIVVVAVVSVVVVAHAKCCSPFPLLVRPDLSGGASPMMPVEDLRCILHPWVVACVPILALLSVEAWCPILLVVLAAPD